MGKIEVITGPMFSGKSDEICRRARRYEIAGKKVGAFHSALDNRFSNTEIVSRSGYKIPSIPTTDLTLILSDSFDFDIIIIDEAQFFSERLISLVGALRKLGKIVIVAGLDMTCEREPFGPMPQIMAIADDVLKLKAVCTECGNDAPISYRLVDNNNEILVGDKEYTALCWSCYYEKRESTASFNS